MMAYVFLSTCVTVALTVVSAYYFVENGRLEDKLEYYRTKTENCQRGTTYANAGTETERMVRRSSYLYNPTWN